MDHDGDGLDDVTLNVSIEGGGAPFEPLPRVAATLRWFDRPAGLSRDIEEPDASLRALALTAATYAKKVNTAPLAAPLVRAIRTLFSALCDSGGFPRLVEVLGAPSLSCGPSRALEEAELALVRAHVTLGDAAGAIAAFDRARGPGAPHTAARDAEAEALITKLAPVSSHASLRVIVAFPKINPAAEPSWGALAFGADGMLLVRTTSGVVRVDPNGGGETEARDVEAWPDAVASNRGTRWTGVVDPCDGFALHATFARATTDGARDVALPIVPPFGVCAARNQGAHPISAGDVLPVAWGPSGLEAIVMGEATLIAPDAVRATLMTEAPDAPVTLGSPRSPDGRNRVMPTSLGILVDGAGARLLRAKELEGGYLDLRDCAVADDPNLVACVRGGRAFVGRWEAAPRKLRAAP